METRISVVGCGRYTFDHRWKGSITPTTFISIWYVNSGWADIIVNKEKHRFREGHLYFMSRFSGMEILDYENFDHTYLEFISTRPFYTGSYMEIEVNSHGLNHLLEYGNTLITGPQSVRDFNSKAIVKYIETILAHLDIHYKLPFVKNKHIINAVEIIDNMYSNISVEELADMLNISISYVIRIFKNELGLTPMQYIQMNRLSNAKEMLKSGLSVTKVSEKCGYSSPASFSYAYKQKFGYPPSDTSKI